jgi:hypothetical protein
MAQKQDAIIKQALVLPREVLFFIENKKVKMTLDE